MYFFLKESRPFNCTFKKRSIDVLSDEIRPLPIDKQTRSDDNQTHAVWFLGCRFLGLTSMSYGSSVAAKVAKRLPACSRNA